MPPSLPAEWCDVLLTNKTDTSSQAFDILKALHCPITPKNNGCDYAMNRKKLVEKQRTSQFAPDTVMLFESDAGWNAVGGPEIAVPRHHNGLNVVLADGSVRQINFKDLENLRWDPYTNGASR